MSYGFFIWEKKLKTLKKPSPHREKPKQMPYLNGNHLVSPKYFTFLELAVLVIKMKEETKVEAESRRSEEETVKKRL